MSTTKKPVQKVREHRYLIRGSEEAVSWYGDAAMYLCAYRPVWSQQGLMTHLTLIDQHLEEGKNDEVPLGRINLFDLRDREVIARALASLVDSGDTPKNWHYELATFFGDVIESERSGRAPVRLSDVVLPNVPLTVNVDGLELLGQHPTIVFGDGESAKSLLALWLAGRLTQLGRRVLYLDWELDAEDHRVRLGMLFPDAFPDVRYFRCMAPLTEIVEDVQRYVEKERIDYLILDSAAFACSGPSESSEAATSYFQALKDIGVPGTLSLAHTTKHSKDAKGQEKPFGSTFWHNGARGTWFVKEPKRTEGRITATLAPRKNNLRSRGGEIPMSVDFTEDTIRVTLSAAEEEMSKDERVVEFVKGNPGCSRNDVCKSVVGDKRTVLNLVKSLITDGRLEPNAKGRLFVPKSKGSFSSAIRKKS